MTQMHKISQQLNVFFLDCEYDRKTDTWSKQK